MIGNDTRPVVFEPGFAGVATVLRQHLPAQRRPAPPKPDIVYTCFWCGYSGTEFAFQCPDCAPLHPDHTPFMVRLNARDILHLRLAYAAVAYRMVLEWVARAIDTGRIREARAVIEVARITPLRGLTAALHPLEVHHAC